METKIVLLILFAHWIADFVLQTDKMAINKSKSNIWLLFHVLSYTAGIYFFIGLFWIVTSHPIGNLFFWAISNGAIHFFVDYFTSRLNSYLYKKDMRHWFFVGIGFDQFIHYACLLLTYPYFFN